ncbi:cytochrome c oxidase subunit II [Variovorax soli]|uniref:cytochrome c oxidase subunit II n=1 Tax=Variovorax soli TaxID=376815 RepID=UPI000837A9D5|nr:cytochrome c oxidase subunit II [Variovorax soli]
MNEALRVSQSALKAGGPVADELLDVTVVLVAGASLIFLGVMALLAVALMRQRRGAPPKARWWIWGGGVAFPCVVLVVLFLYSEWHRPAWRPVPPRDALMVSITGHLWWWEVRLRDPATGVEVVLANELRIPVGRPVYVGLASADVLHSFWVPSLAGKMDMVPGRLQHLLLQADRPGIWRGQCAEFCGTQHARMALLVVAQAPQAFEQWLANQSRPAAPLPDTPEAAVLARGREAFLQRRCQACHAVRGVAESSRLGPDLTHVGSRLSLGAGTLATSSESLADWVAHTQQHKPGAHMPSAARTPDSAAAQEIEDIAAWLAHLR